MPAPHAAAQPSMIEDRGYAARESSSASLTARTCDLRSRESLFYGGRDALDKTGCSINRSLPGHAELATARCEAPGTTSPPVIRYVEPRGEADSASTEAERSKG